MNRKKGLIVIVLLILSASALIIFRYRTTNCENSESITVDGLERTYCIYPASHNETTPVPLLIALHGGGGTGAGMIRLTGGGFNDLADEEGFVVVYPDAVEGNWNDGRGLDRYRSQREDIDDVGFISALIDKIASERPIDLNRVYVTGISNGALMSFRLACELSDRIAAIAPVDGSMLANFSTQCSPTEPVPVLMMNGIDDPLVPWEGGQIHFGDLDLGEVLSVNDSVNFWVHHNNCSENATSTWEPDRDPDDGTRVYREEYGNGTDDSEVILYAVEGGGHTWPGGVQYLPEATVGKTSYDIDANQVIWSFFKNHSRSTMLNSPPLLHRKAASQDFHLESSLGAQVLATDRPSQPDIQLETKR